MAKTIFTPEGTNGTRFTQDDSGLDLLDTINGTAQKTARTWQIIALVSMVSFFISLGLLIYVENLPRTIPVIVTVNPEGQANYIGALDPKKYSAEIPEIAREYIIREFIGKMHTWIIDRDAQKRYIAETQNFVQGGATGQLDHFYRSNNPFDRIGEAIQSVFIEPVHKEAEKTYFLYFTTVKKTASGQQLEQNRFSVLLTLDDFTPSAKNPLGVFITNFDIKAIR
jgi:type IV secretory pathway TrbF-like protein